MAKLTDIISKSKVYHYPAIPFYFIVILLMLSGMAQSESLSELQEKAIANRRLVEKYRLDVEKGQLDETIARNAFLPSVDAAYTANRLDEDSMSENSENSALAGSITYNIFSGFKKTYDLQSAELVKKSKDYELESIIQDIKYSVAARYLDIFGKKNNLKVAEDEYKLLKKRYEDANNMYHVGLTKKNDLLKIQVELDNAEQNMKKAEAELTKSVNRIELETNSAVDPAELKFNEFDSRPEVKSSSLYESEMLEKRSDIKAVEMVLQAKHAAVESVRAAYYPSVDISGSYKKYGDNYIWGQGSESEDEIRVQLTAKMNLFNGYKTDDAVKKAHIDVKMVENDLYELKQNLGTELKNTLLDYDVALKNLKVAESSISQADENLRITDVSFKEGVETAAEVLDAIFYLSRAKYNFINARNELFLDYYKLQRMINGF
jgi:outer membrane protein TolC